MAQQRLTCSTNDVSEAVATVKEKKESWNSAAEHTSDTTLHITTKEREKWDGASELAGAVEERLATLEADTGWIDCIGSATTDGFAFDDTYTQSAKIRKIGKYVSFRGAFKVISNGNDAYVRGFVRSVIPSGYRPSEAILAQCSCYTYTSSTSANYQAFTAQITTDGAIAVFVNNGGTLADIYGKTIRVNMDWLID